MKVMLQQIINEDDRMVESCIWNNEGGRRTWNKNTVQHAQCVLQHATYKKFNFEFPLP